MPNTGIEPVTLRLLAWRSSQLSYAAACGVHIFGKTVNKAYNKIKKIPTKQN